MTLNASWFLNATGQFLGITPAMVGISTSTSTGLLGFLTKSTTANQLIISGTPTDVMAVSQGSSGVWYASATITFSSTGTPNTWFRLWDGTTTMASGNFAPPAINSDLTASLSGAIIAPAGNIKVTIESSNTNVTTKFSDSGFATDCTLTAIRIG